MQKIEFEDYSVTFDNRGGRTIKSDSGDYNFLFNSRNGFTCKFGKNKNDNPDFSPFGNEIADIEITTSCRGIRDSSGNRKPCGFCYKCNSEKGAYMSFEKFKKIFDLMNQPRTMTQIALGADAECKGNPDVWKIMDYCNENSVIPNITVADIDKEIAENIAKRCGACAVSVYERDKNRCYDSVELLTKAAKEIGKNHFQANIHLLVSDETKDFCNEVIDDILSDDRLKELNALVLLSLKQKGRGKSFSIIKRDSRKEIISRLLSLQENKKINFGMDSCGANFFLDFLKENKKDHIYEHFIEPCESFLFSIYVNVNGEAFPCSFMENEKGWEKGIDLLDDSISNFRKDVWMNSRVVEWRDQAVKNIHARGCNSCPYFNV